MAKDGKRSARRRRHIIRRRWVGVVLQWLTPGLVLTVAWGIWTVLSEVPTVEPPYNTDNERPLAIPFTVENKTGFTFYGISGACASRVDFEDGGRTGGVAWNSQLRLGDLEPGDKGAVGCGIVGRVKKAYHVVIALSWRRFGWIPRRKQYGFTFERTSTGRVYWIPTGQSGARFEFPPDPDAPPEVQRAWLARHTPEPDDRATPDQPTPTAPPSN